MLIMLIYLLHGWSNTVFIDQMQITSEQFKSWAQKIQGTKEDVEGEQEQQDPYNGPHNADDFTAAVQLCGLYKNNHFKGYHLIGWFEFFYYQNSIGNVPVCTM